MFPNNATHSNAAVASAIANVTTNAGVVYDPIGQTNGIQVFNFGTLEYTGPLDVSLTLERIRSFSVRWSRRSVLALRDANLSRRKRPMTSSFAS